MYENSKQSSPVISKSNNGSSSEHRVSERVVIKYLLDTYETKLQFRVNKTVNSSKKRPDALTSFNKINIVIEIDEKQLKSYNQDDEMMGEHWNTRKRRS